jgi:predicted DNA-binding transcriptional regulator YafY
MKLFQTFKHLILEIASADAVTDAIRNRKVCVINYQGDEPGGNGLRTIEPVCYGYSKAGNQVLRAWDFEGASHRAYTGEKPLPGWRMFRLDKITMLRPTGETFDEPRPNYNPKGDKSMTRVIINAVFDQTPTETPVDNTNTIIDSMIDTILDEYRTRYGTNFDMSKAADVYRRIYQEIEKKQNKKLTTIDKNELQPIIRNKILEKQ